MIIVAAESSEFGTLSELHCCCGGQPEMAVPLLGCLDPGAGDVIAHGHEEHDGQPENGRDDYELCALRAVFGVHEEEHNERSLKDGDGEGDNNIQAREIGVEVYLGGGDGQEGANHQNAEYGDVDLG